MYRRKTMRPSDWRLQRLQCLQSKWNCCHWAYARQCASVSFPVSDVIFTGLFIMKACWCNGVPCLFWNGLDSLLPGRGQQVGFGHCRTPAVVRQCSESLHTTRSCCHQSGESHRCASVIIVTVPLKWRCTRVYINSYSKYVELLLK